MFVSLLFFSLLTSVTCWTKVRDERLPGELRFVNEGLAHDDTHWILSNKHFLYKATVGPIQIVLANHDAVTPDMRATGCDHIGDIDVLDGIIYGGIEGCAGGGVLATWNSTDLQMIRHTTTTQKDMPWVAIDPTSKYIYSAVWNDCCNLQVYDMNTFDFIKSVAVGNDTVHLPGEIQGGAFYDGELYLAVNGDDGIWKVNIATGELSFVLSDVYNHHEYEMEGLDFWDLREQKHGVMHMYGNFMQAVEKCIRSYDP